MKRKASLAQKLTGLIAATVLIQISFVVVFFLGYFEPRLEKNTQDVIEAGILARAKTYAAQWNYDILLASQTVKSDAMDPELQKKLKQVVSEEKHISGIALYRLYEGAIKTNAMSLQKGFRLLAEVSRPGSDFDANPQNIRSVEHDITYFLDVNAYAGTPITVEGEVIGYLLYARSIKEYRDELTFYKLGMGAAMLLVLFLQLAAVFLIGSRMGRPVTQLAETASQIAAGDLTRAITIPKGAVKEITALSNAIAEMSKAIRDQVTLIKSLTSQASVVSQNVARAMSHLASSASEQAAAVSQTATTVEEMEKSGKTVVDSVRKIVDAAERSAEASNRGSQAVATASGIIVKIRDDSTNVSSHSRMLLTHVEEVGNIISSVNAIAEQSKILAVNASIEAAKAGEFGSGFAVVAQEVKNLAGQSKEATEQITKTLTAIRHSVETMVRLSRDGEERTSLGVASVANTGAIVNDLSDAIQEASEVANAIEASVNQQSTGLSQIASAMDEINISATENQKISQSIEQSTAEMTRALDELSVLVDVWITAEMLQK